MKCKTCLTEKPVSEFYRTSLGNPRLSCKTCVLSSQKARRDNSATPEQQMTLQTRLRQYHMPTASEAADALDDKDKEIERLRMDISDIEILSDRLEAPQYVKDIHRLAKAALKGDSE